MTDPKELTIQVHWNGQWHDAGQVYLPKPDKGLLGPMTFHYDARYVDRVTTREEGLTFTDERAIGFNVPGHLVQAYGAEVVAPVLRDIIPQGAGRRYLLRHWDIQRDPGPGVDYRLLSEGCIAPIGNLRIKEAAERFEALVAKRTVYAFTREDISSRDAVLLDYANDLGVIIGGATGAGGDAPKLLVVEGVDGKYYLEGTLPEAEIATHWLVKFPRGRVTEEDEDILRAEGVFYQALRQFGQNAIHGAEIHEGKTAALWLPRFDRKRTETGIQRLGVESMYCLGRMIGDGAPMNHLEVLETLRQAINHPPQFDDTLCEYLVRDVINHAIGNTDNHGRNTALMKNNGCVSLTPAYDLAPMVLDREAVARTTKWPGEYEVGLGDPDYGKIIETMADDPERTRKAFVVQMGRLCGLREKVTELGMPKRVLEHKRVPLEWPEKIYERMTSEEVR